MVAHIFNPNLWEAEEGGGRMSVTYDHPGPHSQGSILTLLQQIKKKPKCTVVHVNVVARGQKLSLSYDMTDSCIVMKVLRAVI